MAVHPSILLIEDSPGECELFRLALAQTGLDVSLHTEPDAARAFHFLEDRIRDHKVSTSPLKEGDLNWSPTARVQRGELPTFPATARCASKGDHSGPPPDLILLDLNLCGRHGCEFLKRLRADARFVAIPVVIFTTSDAATDMASCYANGANGYVVKPGTFDELVRFAADLCRFWLTWNKTAIATGAPC